MKNWVKIFMIFNTLLLLFQHNVHATDKKTPIEDEQKEVFINPIFYQNLNNENFFYVLSPDSKYFESATATNSVKCQLLENKKYHIKLICDDCIDATCLQKQKRSHDFFLSENIQEDKLYYIKHEVTDNIGNSILRENLTTDGYLARRPDLF